MVDWHSKSAVTGGDSLNMRLTKQQPKTYTSKGSELNKYIHTITVTKFKQKQFGICFQIFKLVFVW
jgi:hypothetical protein